jgi:hypothetical protein
MFGNGSQRTDPQARRGIGVDGIERQEIETAPQLIEVLLGLRVL